MTNDTHLSALRVRLSHERDYLARAKTQAEVDLRTVWIAQIEKEIASELAFLGLSESTDADAMTDDKLLKALEA